MSEFDKLIYKLVDQKVSETLHENGLVLKLLEDFEDVDFLTFEETRSVFRVSEKKLLDGIKSGNVPRPQKIGKSPDDWRFSKRLIFDCLTGAWEPVKGKKEKTNLPADDFKLRALELVKGEN